VNNTIRVFKEAFTRPKRYTKRIPLVKLKKENGEPHACALICLGELGHGRGHSRGRDVT
jgi:hypothetical protein